MPDDPSKTGFLTSAPEWVTDLMLLYQSATGVGLTYSAEGQWQPGDATDQCLVCQTLEPRGQRACEAWHNCLDSAMKRLQGARSFRCPLELDLLCAQVSKDGVVYGTLVTEALLPASHPVQNGDRPNGSSRPTEDPTPPSELGRRLRDSLSQLYRLQPKQRDGLLLLLELLAERVAARLHLESRLPVMTDPSTALVRRAKEFLSSHYHASISTCDVAEELSVSESHLCHAFRSVTGSTLVQHLNELRFQEVCRLLLDYPKLTVAEVAFAAGFQSLSRFYAQFQRRNMPPPKEWRRTHAVNS